MLPGAAAPRDGSALAAAKGLGLGPPPQPESDDEEHGSDWEAQRAADEEELAEREGFVAGGGRARLPSVGGLSVEAQRVRTRVSTIEESRGERRFARSEVAGSLKEVLLELSAHAQEVLRRRRSSGGSAPPRRRNNHDVWTSEEEEEERRRPGRARDGDCVWMVGSLVGFKFPVGWQSARVRQRSSSGTGTAKRRKKEKGRPNIPCRLVFEEGAGACGCRHSAA